MAKWFICQNKDVEGPFGTEELEQRLESGGLDDNSLIWGSPQSEWTRPSKWRQSLPELLKHIQPTKEEQHWHYVFNEISYGPFRREELVERIKDNERKSEIFVWTNGMASWTPLFECPELMEAIGISRRLHPRASIEGAVHVEVHGEDKIGQLRTISAGGCGILGVKGLDVGQVVHISMHSNHFFKNLNAKAEVRYITDKGFVGLKFDSINMEEKAAIINYVKGYFLHQEQAA